MIKENLKQYVFNCKKINTHCHHMDYGKMMQFPQPCPTLFSYIGWCFGRFDTYENIKNSFSVIRCRSYYRYFNCALKKIYGLGDLNEKTFEQYNRIILQAEKEDDNFLRFKKVLNYEHVLEDAYWNYGDNLGDKNLFTPSFRLNIFLNGFNRDFVDQDGYSIDRFIPEKVGDIEGYCRILRATMINAKAGGAVSFKCAIAYERGLDFYKTLPEKANVALVAHTPTKENIKDFQSYVFYKMCEYAGELDMPIQIHTGLGQIEGTGALNLTRVIKDNPKTKFVIFHMSFPSYTEALSLAHNFNNVYVDLCWIPLISDSHAKQCLRSTFDMVNIDRICWGCDTWTFEESYGAVLAIAEVLSSVLADMVSEEIISVEDAKQTVDYIMYANAKKLYKL